MPTPLTADQLLAQSKAMELQTKAQGATPFAGSSYDTMKPTTPVITPSSLTPQTPIQPVTTPPVTVPTTPALVAPPVSTTPPATDANYTPLAQETGIYKMLQELQGKSADLGSQEAFQTAQNAKYGVDEKQGLVNSLKNQFDALSRQAEGLTLQQQQNIQNIQNQAQQGGANVTRGGLAPQERASQTQTNQQLLSLSIQQNNIASQHALASGDLATAISLADRAVKMEYQPKKDALDAQRANIELLLKDPTLTLAQQKRADELKLKNDLAVKQLEIDSKNKETLQGLILQAQQNGAPVALTNQAMKDGTIFGAAQILGGYTAKETANSIQEYNFAVKNGYKGSFSDYQNEDANRKAQVASAGVVTPGAPTSYKEWELAGKPGTYADYLSTQSIKAPTVAQQTVATYAARIEQALPTIDTLTNKISKMNPVEFEAQKRLPSYLQSAEYQQFDQASRNFINSVLRRESGAVISPSEFDNAYKQYLPKAGDTAQTLEQKKQNRDVVYASLRKAAGNAYQSVDELLGNTQSKTAFADIQSKLSVDPNDQNTVYISSADWAKLGNRKDALLAEIKADGGKLLVK